MKLERKFLLPVLLGLVVGRIDRIGTFFEVISFNQLIFLSLFGGLMVLGCLTPAIIEFLRRNRDKKVKTLLWVGGLSISFFTFSRIGLFQAETIEHGNFGNISLRLQIKPLVNFTTAVTLSLILGYISVKRKTLEKSIREYGKGIEEVVKTIILPGFLLATPGIVSALSSDFYIKSSYLINIGAFAVGLIAAFFLLRGKITSGWARGIQKIFFVGILVAPVLIAADISIWMILIYLQVVTLAVAINPKIPPMVALGLFGEFIEAAPSVLGVIIIFYFILSGVERQFYQKFQLKESSGRVLKK